MDQLFDEIEALCQELLGLVEAGRDQLLCRAHMPYLLQRDLNCRAYYRAQYYPQPCTANPQEGPNQVRRALIGPQWVLFGVVPGSMKKASDTKASLQQPPDQALRQSSSVQCCPGSYRRGAYPDQYSLLG